MSSREPASFEQFKIRECRFCRRCVRYDVVMNRTLELIGDEAHVCPRKQAFLKDKGYGAAQAKRDRKQP